MLKLDRTFSTAGKITDNKKETDHYKNHTFQQIIEVFNYLQSVAYNYPINQPLRMDKTIFSAR
jgi:hypothetical protein